MRKQQTWQILDVAEKESLQIAKFRVQIVSIRTGVSESICCEAPASDLYADDR